MCYKEKEKLSVADFNNFLLLIQKKPKIYQPEKENM